ncbi:MAG: glycerol-3-phosphate 1-O-acyltransferase PlsY [Pseudomonadota bacterium]
MPPFETPFLLMIVWAAIGYGLGSIPFGLILSERLGLGNLREIGSGNIGATNVLRTGNKGAAAATLLLDALKGAVAVLLARLVSGEDAAQLAGLMAFLGHCFPVWLNFQGGKGVATFFGILFALAWPVGLACGITWIIAVAITRTSSLGALFAAALSLLWVFALGEPRMFLLAVVLTGLIYWRHWPNVQRLRAGTEPKIGKP